MEPENEQFVASCLTIPDDAGNGNKMASLPAMPINRSKAVEHELKIMDVEGAIPTMSTITIDLDDDDIDDDDLPLIPELHMETIETEKSVDDPLHDEKMSTKTERSTDGDSNGSYNGPDPMGLLERIDSSREVEDDDDEEDSADEASSSGSRRPTRSERWQIWMKRWPWLLHEECDGDYAFCLYCNVVININRKLKYIHQHNMSLYHQERENNYLAFRNSDDYSCDATENEVKHEFGTDSYVAAMKQKRSNEVQKLNNFNWKRWLTWHEWLERIKPDGTIGLCKYCNVRMNVEFVYLRKRHEASKGHCEAQRASQDKPTRKRKRSASLDESAVESKGRKETEEQGAMTSVVGTNVDAVDPSDWCELLPATSPQQCRCTLCDCTMAITSFMRHLKTKVHCHNLFYQKQTQSSNINRGIWEQYVQQHPWIAADPNDPTLAYCHVCCRRFMYGHSEIKRKNHENSEKHLAAVAAAASAQNADEGQTDQEQSEMLTGGSDEDYIEEDDKMSMSQRSSVEPNEYTAGTGKSKHAMRRFSWLRYSKDRKVQLCKFCRVRFHNEASKLRHEHSARHKKLTQQFKSRQAARYREARKQRKNEQNGELEEERAAMEEQSNADSMVDAEALIHPKGVNKAAQNLSVKPVPATMQGKVMVWKDRFPWLSYKRSEPRQNYGWCKLCDVSVFLPSFKYASKHQRTSRHIRLRFERKRLTRLPTADAAAVATATVAALATGEAKHKAAMAELQAKYDWLEPDTSDENHCHCKVCDIRLPIKVFYLRQHDSSRKHLEHLERYKNSSEVTTLTGTNADASVSLLEADQESDEALSVNPTYSRSECSTGEQPSSKRMRRSLEVRRILRALRDSVGKRSDERSQLDMAKDMICSSFDIVSRLRTLERENESRDFASVSSRDRSYTAGPSSPPQPRDTIDLFFESITQTMKGLPADLAAEGKAKIMQIVCDLELRGMQRNAVVPSAASREKPVAPSQSTARPAAAVETNSARPERLTFEEALEDTPVSPESVTSIVLDDLAVAEERIEKLQPLPTKPVEVTQTPKQRSTHTGINSCPPAFAADAGTPTILNGRTKDVPLNIHRFLSSKTEACDPLRVVAVNKVNPHSRTQANGGNATKFCVQRGGQQASDLVATPPNSNSNTSQSDRSSGDNTPVVGKFRISGGKLLTVQPPKTQSMRFSSGDINCNSNSNSSTPKILVDDQAQAKAQSQLLAISKKRVPNVRHLIPVRLPDV